jgi:hypothetical protein
MKYIYFYVALIRATSSLAGSTQQLGRAVWMIISCQVTKFFMFFATCKCQAINFQYIKYTKLFSHVGLEYCILHALIIFRWKFNHKGNRIV